MLDGKKLIVIMPAYNAEKTLLMTYNDLPHDYIDDVILVDDFSSDRTVELAKSLGVKTIRHNKNIGYGGNQKTCYKNAIKEKADIIIMIHPDYQYSPKLALSLATMILSGHYDIALGSRIIGGNTLKGGMPVYKYIANRFLTFIENIIVGAKLSEYHTGFRAYSKQVLETLPFENNSDDFLFDNEFLVQGLLFGFRIGEISCPTKYFNEASSISFYRSVKYGFGVLLTSIKFFLHKNNIWRFRIFQGAPRSKGF